VAALPDHPAAAHRPGRTGRSDEVAA